MFAHKFYFDELYDALFSRPSQVIAARLRDDVEAPVVQGSLGEIATGVRAGGAARLQSGLLRSYVLVIAGSVAVLIVVFLAVRCTADECGPIVLPLVGALACLGAAVAT